jgi:transgelin
LRENVSAFLKAATKYGVPDNELFQTVDLFEMKNISQVTLAIHALGRQAQKHNFNGPTLGVKMAEENKREFTEEQLKASEGFIGLQAGSNKGANQSGQSFGHTRHM